MKNELKRTLEECHQKMTVVDQLPVHILKAIDTLLSQYGFSLHGLIEESIKKAEVTATAEIREAKLCISYQEAGEMLGVSWHTVRKLCETGELRRVKYGATTQARACVLRKSIIEYIERNMQKMERRYGF